MLIIAEQYTKRNFFHYVKPGCLFIPSKEFLRHLRNDRQIVHNRYYKFELTEIRLMKENDIPKLMYIGPSKTGFLEEYVFLFGKELLRMFNDDLDGIRYVEIKIISDTIS